MCNSVENIVTDRYELFWIKLCKIRSEMMQIVYTT